MHDEVVCPDQENQDVDRQDPQHQDQDGVRVVTKVEVRGRSGFLDVPLCPHTCSQLHNTGDHVGELVWDNCRYKDQEDGSVDDASSRRWGVEDRQVAAIFTPDIACFAMQDTVYP